MQNIQAENPPPEIVQPNTTFSQAPQLTGTYHVALNLTAQEAGSAPRDATLPPAILAAALTTPCMSQSSLG